MGVCSYRIESHMPTGIGTVCFERMIDVPHSHPALPDHRPLVIAHRAGNSLPRAVRAIQNGVDMIEADVWRHRKDLEIRHLKTLGPLPVLWDRWELKPGWTPRLKLPELLAEVPPELPIMLDLKGEDPHLPTSIIQTMREVSPEHRMLMCTRNWLHLDRIREVDDVFRIYSVGNIEERDTVFSRLDDMTHPAVSIHADLVTPAIMRAFDDRGVTVISWGVSSRRNAELLLSLGVDGLTIGEGPLQNWLLQARQDETTTANP